jgi:indolepyruvate ferredoxin oxidoreductase beta subunit
MNDQNILLVGVGGQGIILASNILARLGLELGLDVKKSEIHGMSQRGGSVESHVRLGAKVLSPLIPQGEADFLVCLEGAEALRYLDFPKKEAGILVATTRVVPPSVTAGDETYPAPTAVEEELKKHFSNVALYDLPRLAAAVGNPRTANIILLGALSTYLPWPQKAWQNTLAATLPAKILDINQKAFALGRQTAAKMHP